MSAARRRLRRTWFRVNRRLGGGPMGRRGPGRPLAFAPFVAFVVAFGFVVVSRDAPRAAEVPAQTTVVPVTEAAAPSPAAGSVELRPTATLPAPLRPPPRKPRRARVAPPASSPAPVSPAPAATPAPTAAPVPASPVPTPRAQPQPTPAPTFDDSGEGNGSFDLP